MRKTILFLSPIPLNWRHQSGISIRIAEVAEWFKRLGLKVIKTDKINEYLVRKADFVYVLISSKPDSVTSQAAKYANINLIVDLYTPLLLEKETTFNQWNPLDRFKKFKNRQVVKKILQSGLHFLIANHRQKTYWQVTSKSLGVSLKSDNISVLPTGVPKSSDVKSQMSNTRHERSRRVILWFGGIYPWMNPLPAIEAFSRVAKGNSDLKFRIMGGFYPKTGYRHLYESIIVKAKKFIYSSQFQVLPWQNLDGLSDVFSDVILAVHLTRQTQEDYYAHRVRLLTLTNCATPILTSGTDVISRIIIKSNSGLKVPSGSVDKISNILRLTLTSPDLIKKLSKNAPKVQSVYEKEESDYQNLIKFLNE